MIATIYHRCIALAILLCLLAVPVLAAQTMNLSREKAEEAVALVLQSREVVSWCQPCGHTEKILCEVLEAVASPVHGGRWQVAINGEYVDVADIYIHKDGKWANLAFVLGFKINKAQNYLNL